MLLSASLQQWSYTLQSIASEWKYGDWYETCLKHALHALAIANKLLMDGHSLHIASYNAFASVQS